MLESTRKIDIVSTAMNPIPFCETWGRAPSNERSTAMRGGRSLMANLGIILSRRTNKGVKTKNIFLINRKINYIADMSQIEELRAFVLIVETGSLTQAADRMGIAVSAVSRRLRDLELRLGTALIQRSTRRLFLNETGQLFYQRAKTVLSTLEDAEQEVQNAGGALSGVLRISVPLSFGIAHMSTAIAQFMHAHPDIHIEMDLSDKRVDMIAEGFDAAIRIGNLTDSCYLVWHIFCLSLIRIVLKEFGNVYEYHRHTANCDHRRLSWCDDPDVNYPSQEKHRHSRQHESRKTRFCC